MALTIEQRLNEAKKLYNEAKDAIYDACLDAIQKMCEQFNVDHICFEGNSNLPYFYDEEGDCINRVASVRVSPDFPGVIEITTYFEEEWNRAVVSGCDVWLCPFDGGTLNYNDLTDALFEYYYRMTDE